MVCSNRIESFFYKILKIQNSQSYKPNFTCFIFRLKSDEHGVEDVSKACSELLEELGVGVDPEEFKRKSLRRQASLGVRNSRQSMPSPGYGVPPSPGYGVQRSPRFGYAEAAERLSQRSQQSLSGSQRSGLNNVRLKKLSKFGYLLIVVVRIMFRSKSYTNPKIMVVNLMWFKKFLHQFQFTEAVQRGKIIII